MIDDLNEVEQDVLEEIDPDLVSYTFSTRGLNWARPIWALHNSGPSRLGPSCLGPSCLGPWLLVTLHSVSISEHLT